MHYLLSEIADVCGSRLSGADTLCRNALTDSRTAQAAPDPVFFAISGVNHDAHDYIRDLYGRGVRAFVVERQVDTTGMPGAGFVVVPSAVEALQSLAAHHRASFKGVVVAITGSNGKTVVKEWAAQLAPGGVRLVRSPKSYNSQIGVPLSVLMIEGDEQVAIIEAGISRQGEMERLEKVVRPDLGVITTIGDAHQEGFSDIGAKLDEKLKLFAHTPRIIYNSAYTAVGERLRQLYPAATLLDAATEKAAYGAFADRAGQENAASAMAIWRALGYPADPAALGGLQPVAMRLELKEGIAGSQIIDDSYNSDINSLGIALDYLRGVAAGRPTALIISDILQSGMDDLALYAQVAQMVRAAGVSLLVGIGERIARHAAIFGAGAAFYPSAGDFLRSFDQGSLAGHTVLLKGNRSARFELLSHALQLRTHTTTLEVDLDAMSANLSHLRGRLTPGTRVMAMIKAYSYGNGGYEVASMLRRQGVDYLAVAFADEGVALRTRGERGPIVVLNADQDSFDLMVAHNLEPEIYSFASLDAFRAALARHGERDFPVHIKFDTGMHRLGFGQEDIDSLCAILRGDRLIRVATLFSHLAVSDDPAEDAFTLGQIELFDRFSSQVGEALGYMPLRHVANSAAVERFPEARFDMVRLGIGLYGVSAAEDRMLRPVATLRSRVVQVRALQPGQTVGYGRAGVITRPSRIATVPIGYADGLDRGLGEGRWAMLTSGGPAPTIGRICMDTCMIDVTGLDVAEGDPVTVFSPGPGNRVEDMARVLGTIPYEVMTGISTRVKRIFIKE